MDRVWITSGSPYLIAMVNPLNAACHNGYCPTDIYLLANPEIEAITTDAASLMKTIVTAHDADEPAVTVESIEDETDFSAIIAYLQNTIETGQDADADIAVDVTPGRKFWSIISFRAGTEYDVDHLYYTHVHGDYYDDCYPLIPRPAIDLIDFTEVA